MKINIRPAISTDAETCGRIIFESFKNLSNQHGFPCDFPTMEVAAGLADILIRKSTVFSIVAEINGSIVGCNFLNEINPIRSVGPLCVSPDFQGHGVGRRLMEEVLRRAKDSLGIRLIQETLNIVSSSLYISLGFEVKESLFLLTGRPKTNVSKQGIVVRPFTLEEKNLCAELCADIYGFERTQEVLDALNFSIPFIALRGNRLIAYSSSMTMSMTNHCVAKTEEDMKALFLGIAKLTSEPLVFLLPVRRIELFRWCLEEGFRIVKPFTLMSKGEYFEPNGIYCPSASY